MEEGSSSFIVVSVVRDLSHFEPEMDEVTEWWMYQQMEEVGYVGMLYTYM